MGRTHRYYSLTLLLVLATASPVFAQALLNPNQISGRLRFVNQNPEILDIFSESGLALGMNDAFVRAVSVDVTPPLKNSTFAPAESGTSVAYEVTVESSEAGIAYLVSAEARLMGRRDRYIFGAQPSTAVTSEPAADATVNFDQCASLLDIRWVDGSGEPVSVQGGEIRVYHESSPGSDTYTVLRAQSSNLPSHTSQRYMAVEGDEGKYRVDVFYDFGTDRYSDKIRNRCQAFVTASCDEFVDVVCVLPPAGEMGAIDGEIDMIGENESPSTRLFALQGPFNNQRFDQINGTPASGHFEFENLPPSGLETPANGYLVWGSMNFRTGLRAQQFHTPWNRNVRVEGGVTTHMGNGYVIDPGYQVGNITLAGPPVEAENSCVQHLYRDELLDRDGDGIPDSPFVGSSHVVAFASNKVAPGARQSAEHGMGRTRFEGGFDPATGSFQGDYELVLGGLHGENSIWNAGKLVMDFRRDMSDPVHRQHSRITAARRGLGEHEVIPGETGIEDLAYCTSEVNLSFHSSSGTFYSPQARGIGNFRGQDFEGVDVDQAHRLDYAFGAPASASAASNSGLVAMCLPQGAYRLTPTVMALNPDGSTSRTELPPVKFDVGCRQVIDLTPELRVNLAELPQCTVDGSREISGSIRGSGNIARVFYTHNGGPEVDVCTDCGRDPQFSIAVELTACDNEIQVTALDEHGSQASIKTVIRRTVFDAEPPVVSGAQDMSVQLASGETEIKLAYGLSAIDNCAAAVPVITDPPSGYFFLAGDSEVAYQARDVCGNVATGTFAVSVSEYVEPAPDASENKDKDKHDNRSGLGDGTNPGHGAGTANSPNEGTQNPHNQNADDESDSEDPSASNKKKSKKQKYDEKKSKKQKYEKKASKKTKNYKKGSKKRAG